jgi:hypothetical protein
MGRIQQRLSPKLAASSVVAMYNNHGFLVCNVSADRESEITSNLWLDI